MQFTIRHTFESDPDTFWNKLFFDDDYNRALCQDHLQFSLYRVLSFVREENGVIRRRLEIAPRVEIPTAIKKALGDSANYVEDGSFDPAAGIWRFVVIPHIASNKIKTEGTLWVETRGERKIERICNINTEVKIFGIGKLLEDLIEKQTRASYDQAATFTHGWIRERGL
ncbi:MAG: DUF2505 family protein [Deltaproteobacteria bacterium]|nr:DUF2505 family protein [Deltaproteobacteria bacterium]